MSEQHLARSTAFVYEGFLYNPEVAKLGRIVLDPRNPIETYFDVFPHSETLGGEIHITPGIDLACTYNSSKNMSLGGALLRLFRGGFLSSNEQETCVKGEIKRYQLSNAEVHFRNACQQDSRRDVREWLQENVIKPKVDAYMIVGYHTITNPKITNGSDLARAVNIRADDANIVNMAVPGSDGVANINMRSSTRNFSTFQRQISAVGERLWAVQYRKVVYKLEGWLSGSKAKLKDSQWKMMWKVRGQDSSGEYVVEVNLGEAAEPEEEDSDDDDEDEGPPAPPERFVNTVPGTDFEEEFIVFNGSKANYILGQENNDFLSMDASQNESTRGGSMEILSPSEGENDHEMGEAWDTITPPTEVAQITTVPPVIDQPVSTRSPSGSEGLMARSGAGQKRTRGLDSDAEESDAGDSSIMERDPKRLRSRRRIQDQ